MASDFSIAQFRFLERLLLVHGHWCYRRISMMVKLMFFTVASRKTIFVFNISFEALKACIYFFFMILACLQRRENRKINCILFEFPCLKMMYFHVHMVVCYGCG